MKLYDSHMHSENSHDGKYSVAEIAEAAVKQGFDGITVTDHFDCEKYKTKDDFKHIYKSLEDISLAKKLYGKALEIYSGVEIADWIYAKDFGDYCIKTCNFDFILASLHSASTGKRVIDGFKSFRSFSETSEEDDIKFLDLYFKNLKYTAENADFDSLAHLTYPLRYLNGMCNKGFTLDNYEVLMEDILKILIKREKALEINTSGLKGTWNETMPYEELIKLYYSLGGRLITLGSDAHIIENLGLGFDKTIKMLKNIGFDKYYIYKKRKPIAVNF